MKKNFNIGLSILRTIMCFMVVLCHCWNADNAQGVMKLFVWMRGFAVPVFMMMSFILIQPSLIEHDKKKINSRFERLLIPQFGWAIIYWIVYAFIDLLLYGESKLKVTDLLWQVFFGHSPYLNGTMWFQVNLIYLTFLFLIIIIFFKRNYISIFMILGIVAIFIQYSGINMIFQTLRYELKYPIGRLAEMLPVAVAGFIISSNGILEKLKEHRSSTIMIVIFTIFIDAKYGIFSEIPGYGYSRIKGIIVGFCFIALFYIIPFEKVPIKILKSMNVLSHYTMGVYCMHKLIATMLIGTINKFAICGGG